MYIDTKTVCLGILGNPLKHSLSPLMHNQTLQKMGLNYVYLPLEVENKRISQAVEAIRTLGFRGVNVTIPFKEEVVKYLDDLSEGAAACGSVNLISNENGKLIGYNTDGLGFLASLEEENVLIPQTALFIGAGGAARSLAYELSVRGMSQVYFMDIDGEKAQQLATFINQKTSCQASASRMDQGKFSLLSQSANLIINCSPVGMYPHIDKSPVATLDQLKTDAVLYDIIYNPVQTRLLDMGRIKGLKTINGVSMLVHQGALTLKILLGVEPPIKFMKEVVLSQLG